MGRDSEGFSGFKIMGVIFVFLTVLGGLILAFTSWVTVPAGSRGVLLHTGAVTGTVLPEGANAKTPFADEVVDMSVQVVKEEANAEAASKDLQTVHTTVAVNLHVRPASVATLYQRVGLDYMVQVVAPAIIECVKAVTARYTAEELITRREAVRDEIETLLAGKMDGYGIEIEKGSTNIVNFDFSQSFNISIEAKVTAEQNALAAKNKLEQTRYEAQQAEEVANGKAKALTIESQALRDNPQVLQLRALEKWNGVLPQVVGGSGAMPFISIDAKPIK